MDFRADNRRALLQRVDVTHKGFRLTVDLHDIGDLDDGVFLGLGEFTLSGRTFNIKGHDTERGNLGVLAFARERLNSVKVTHIEFDLARTHFLRAMTHLPILLRDLDPRHSSNLVVDHEAQRIRHVTLVGDRAQYVFAGGKFYATLEHLA